MYNDKNIVIQLHIEVFRKNNTRVFNLVWVESWFDSINMWKTIVDYLGKLVENGEYPCYLEILGNIVEEIYYNNAKKYFEK